MKYSFGVQESDAIHDFINNVLDLIITYQETRGRNEVHQVFRTVFKHKIQLIEAINVPWSHYRLQLHNILVPFKNP